MRGLLTDGLAAEEVSDPASEFAELARLAQRDRVGLDLGHDS